MTVIPKLLLQLKAVDINTETGFTYASGIQSPVYCDNRLILSYPKEREIILGAFLKLIEDKSLKFDIVAGVATAGIPWAAMIADRLKKPLVYVRTSAKEHGKGNQVEGELEEGKYVLLVEDLISTGGSSIGAAKTVQETCNVIACVAIFNYNLTESEKNFTEAKLSLYSLADFNGLIKVADRCLAFR